MSVTVTNLGNQATGELNLALTGANPDSFELSSATVASIAEADDDMFTVSPKTGLEAGTHTATVTVSGGNGITESFDVSFTVNPAPKAPTAPQDFTATPGDTEVELSWTAPASEGDAAISGYEVFNDNGNSWIPAATETGHTFTGLTNGTQYTFKVRAVNSVGYGAEATATATPAAPTAPDAPQYFIAIPGDTEVVLSWAAPDNDGGAAITGYEVFSDNGNLWEAATTNSWHTFTGLTNDQSYTFKVRALNSEGNGKEATATATPQTATPEYGNSNRNF